jgi:anti-anti-sigma regulatory factor
MAAFSVQIKDVPEQAGTVNVIVTGAATIANANTLLMHLLAAFHHADNVILDVHGVTEIDTAGLQLLCSSHRSSLYIGKKFSLTGQQQSLFREAAAASGQLRTSGCALDTEHMCIWTESAY